MGRKSTSLHTAVRVILPSFLTPTGATIPKCNPGVQACLPDKARLVEKDINECYIYKQSYFYAVSPAPGSACEPAEVLAFPHSAPPIRSSARIASTSR